MELLDGLIETMEWLIENKPERGYFDMATWRKDDINSSHECNTYMCIIGWHVWLTHHKNADEDADSFVEDCCDLVDKLYDQVGFNLTSSIYAAGYGRRQSHACRHERSESVGLNTQHPHLTTQSSPQDALDYMKHVREILRAGK